ncbi:hypothetical protein [Desulfopila sp. IMCC35008]|uniref:hypothetical protein n=1 Tax=Desulfopila sp. IMCC35008 TaxID=2653858 RepID=UPI0013D63E1E|nr:hypothetical protein [Desulfopila sp. IMCC35008]
MSQQKRTAPELDWHILFLGRIYSFTGWLGLVGGGFLLLSLVNTQPQTTQVQTQVFGMHPSLSAFLLTCWSMLLLGFSKDIRGQQRWTTGIAGWLIGAFHLISVPIGTAIGTYTLWILARQQYLARNS